MSQTVRRVLVIKLGGLSDFVLSLGAMRRIRATHRHARITLLTTSPFEGLAKSTPYFNEIDTRGRPEGPGDWLALRARIKAAKYDRVYDLDSSGTTKFLFHMLRPFPPVWSGSARGAALRHRNRNRMKMHILERLADQLKAAGIWDDAPVEPGSAPAPDLSFVLRKVAAPRGPTRPFAILVPGGSAKRPEKRWPTERFADLAGRLHARGLDIVVLGGPEESALARAIQRKVRTARDLTGRTDFAQVAVLGARAALAVGNETGRMHVLAAAGAPAIALFSGSSDPALTAPRGHVAVLHATDLQTLPVDDVERAVNNLMPPGA